MINDLLKESLAAKMTERSDLWSCKSGNFTPTGTFWHQGNRLATLVTLETVWYRLRQI